MMELFNMGKKDVIVSADDRDLGNSQNGIIKLRKKRAGRAAKLSADIYLL